MPKVSRPPVYSRQKETGRSDRAYVFIAGRKILLGTYGSAESYKRYAEIINAKPAARPVPQPAPTTTTVTMLMADYLRYAIAKYGERGSEVVHLKSICRMMRSL